MPQPGSRLLRRYVSALLVSIVTIGFSGCRLLQPPASQNVTQARWLTSLGFDALQKDQVEQAKGCFMRACDACPDDQRLRENLAEAHKRGGHFNQAISELNKVLPHSNNPAKTHKELGELYLLQGQLRPALEHANQSISLDRNAAIGWDLRGRALARMGHNDAAIESFNRALTLENNDDAYAVQIDAEQVRLHLAESLIEIGNLKKAMTVLETVSGEHPENRQPESLALVQGRLFEKMKMPGKASEVLARAARNPDNSSRVFLALSRSQQKQGDWTAAQNTLRLAAQKFPGDPSIQTRMADLNSNVPEMAKRY